MSKKDTSGLVAPKEKIILSNILVEGVLADLYNPLVERAFNSSDNTDHQVKFDERSKTNQEKMKLLETELAQIEECTRTRKRNFDKKAAMLENIKNAQTKMDNKMEKHKQNKEKVHDLQEECEELRKRRETFQEPTIVMQPLLQRLQINWDDKTCAEGKRIDVSAEPGDATFCNVWDCPKIVGDVLSDHSDQEEDSFNEK